MVEDKKIEYEQFVEHIGRFKVVHNTPILTDEEKKEKDKEIIIKISKSLSNHKG